VPNDNFEIVYEDPISTDWLLAMPAPHPHAHARIAIERDGSSSPRGEVIIAAGEELDVLTALGNQLLGLTSGGENEVIVTTSAELEAIRTRILELRASSMRDAVYFALNDLIDALILGLPSMRASAPMV
jgi:hypothetical protein